MRVAIMGAGGVGGYYGAKLARHGADVTFVARGAHLEAIRRNGLKIVIENADENADGIIVDPAMAMDDTSGTEPVDVILFCVKLHDTEAAARACLPLMHDDTCFVTLQNGVESLGMIEKIVGPGRVLGGSVYIVASIREPGVIARTGPSERMEFAEPDGSASERAETFAALCHDAGIDAHLKSDMSELLWRKFILLSASSAITSLTRQPIGFAQQDPVAGEVVRAAIAETTAVARALGIDLADDIEDATFETLNFILGADAKSSQLFDLELGKPLELDWLSGAIHRMGKEVGVPTPVHTTAYAALRPYSGGDGCGARKGTC